MSEPVALIWYFLLSQTVLLSWLYVRQHHCYKARAWGLSRAIGAGQHGNPSSVPGVPFSRGARAARRLHSCRHPGSRGRSATLGEGCRSRSTSRGQPWAGSRGGGGGAGAARGSAPPAPSVPPGPARPRPPGPSRGRGRRSGAGGTGAGEA